MELQPVTCSYISCGCNQTPFAVDWGLNGIICYASCNSVAVYDPQAGGSGRVLYTLKGHTDRVNGVRWIKSLSQQLQETEIVSVSSDKTAIVWSLDKGVFKSSAILKGHTGIVTYTDAKYVGSSAVVATSSVDSTIRIWERSQFGEFTCMETIDLKGGVCLSMVFFWLRETLFLACGNDDCKIHIYRKGDRLLCLEGHEDWVRSIDTMTEAGRDLLLASGSQDTSIRMWRFSQKTSEENSLLIKPKELILNLGDSQWAVTSESVLHGHSDWVYGVQWTPQVQQGDRYVQSPVLMSCSLDRTLLLWSPDPDTGVWLEQIRVGEIGGNTLGGYYGARFGPEGNTLIAHSYTGGFHMWQKTETWKPGVKVGGHFAGVVDISWEKAGRYLLSVSLDQTTRLHAPWSTATRAWHEMSRPQTHGFDMASVTALPDHRFVSAAEEKVSRVFTAPLDTLRLLTKLSNVETKATGEEVPTSATTPALGLSNQAVFEQSTEEASCPPSEPYLAESTLWPEVMKLYGHGYDVYCLASTTSGDLVASACKATSKEDASIILWNTRTWDKHQELLGHNLTVTQMEFSPNDHYLLSVSRDRTWCLFERQGDNFALVACTNKTNGIHARIIWSCSWSHDSTKFATSSREGKVVVWGDKGVDQSSSFQALSEPLVVKDSVTAVSFARQLVNGSYFLAVGSETGSICCFLWDETKTPWQLCFTIQDTLAHQLTVKKLSFRPKNMESSEDADCIQLASCSLDFSVRVYDIHLGHSCLYWK